MICRSPIFTLWCEMRRISRLIKRLFHAGIRYPVALLVMELQSRQHSMQQNPVGVDQLSNTGYDILVDTLRMNETTINSGEAENNVLWDALEQTSKYFTVAEYLQILQLSKYTMGLIDNKGV